MDDYPPLLPAPITDWASTPHLPGTEVAKLLETHASRKQAWMDSDDRAQDYADPDKATLIQFAKLWLVTLHDIWEEPKEARKAAATLSEAFRSPPQDWTSSAFSNALLRHCRMAGRHLLWEHPSTKTAARFSFANKAAFTNASVLDGVDLFDPPTVIATIEAAGATTPEMSSARRQAIEGTLRTLGHFTSKSSHTSASPVGIVLGKAQQGIGPYLTAGRVLESGRPLRLDQTINDNTGKVSACLDVLNEAGAHSDSPTARLIRNTAEQLLAMGHERGADIIDPRLRQILLPTKDGSYRAITPLTSMGLSAYLHSHWDEDESFAKPMRYGFSPTAITNITAIRKVPVPGQPGESIANIPNLTLVFNVPELEEAQRTLSLILHRGFKVRFDAATAEGLIDQYLAHGRILSGDTVRAIETERRIWPRALVRVWLDLQRQREHCIEALDDMGEEERAAVLSSLSGKRAVDRYLLVGMETTDSTGVSPAALARDLATLIFNATRRRSRKHNGQDKFIGLDAQDKQRFLRWAPDAIAHLFNRL